MKIAKPNQRLARKWVTAYVLDAPGISGHGPDSLKRMQEHADAGGEFWHPIRVRIS